MSRLSTKSKLTIILLLVTLFAIGVIGVLGWRGSRSALNDAIFNQLTSVRTSKARQIEEYFTVLRNQTAFLAEDHMVVSAMVRLNRGYQELHNTEVTPEMDERLATYYTDTFIPQLQKNLSAGVPDYHRLQPGSQTGRYLQYHYMVANGNATGYKHFLDDAGDGSTYSQFHQQYQPPLRDLVLRFGYHDLFLININTGEIVFSVFKESDFATNLLTGPYRQSALAELIRAVQGNPIRQQVAIVDFQPYLPSYNVPAAFIAAPIYNGTSAVGILAMQFPLDAIDRIMTGDQSWQAEGLGASGEAYLVGPDHLMRSNSRFLLEDKVNYLTTLRQLGIADGQIHLIEQLQTSILLQEIDTAGAQAALEGEADTRVIDDYRGIPVLSSFAPLNLPGLHWVILAEIDVAEAFAPVLDLQRRMYILSISVIFVVILIALAATNLMTRPLHRLIAYTERAQRGEFDQQLTIETKDEFGHLARALNGVIQTHQHQTRLLERRTTENRTLLHSVLPPAVAVRLQRGEERIIDTIHQTSIVCATFVGFTPLLGQKGEAAATAVMDELMQAFDEAARRHELERQRTLGESYTAICGLDMPHLDHCKRAVNFALELFQLVSQSNEESEVNLGLRVSVHSGTIVAGVLGGNKFMYNLWGAPLKVAMTLAAQAERNTLLITDEVYQRLDQPQNFVRRGPIWVDEVGELLTWARLEQEKLSLRQIDLVQSSFAKCLPISEEVAEQFYYRLFELAPSARALFPTNMQEQQRKLMNTLNVAVGALNSPDKIIPILQKLGRKHVEYGATDDGYQVVGEALIWTLQVRLGDEFTLETEEAWLAAYGWLSTVMLSAAQEVAPAPPIAEKPNRTTSQRTPIAQIAAAGQAKT